MSMTLGDNFNEAINGIIKRSVRILVTCGMTFVDFVFLVLKKCRIDWPWQRKSPSLSKLIKEVIAFTDAEA